MTGPFRILVVDDEPKVRRTVGDFLALHGFQVTLAGDAEAHVAPSVAR